MSASGLDNGAPAMDQLQPDGEDRFRAMADTAPVLMWIAGADGKATFFNASWLRFTGRTLAQELGTGWLEGVHPEDRQRCVGNYLAAFFARRSFETEYRLRRHDGEYRWVVDSGAPRSGPSGEFAGYVGSCIDITPRRWAQQELARVNGQLQAVLDASHQVAIIATDPEGEITLFNRGAEAMLGAAATAVIGRLSTQLVRDVPEFAARRERLSAEFGRPIDGFDVLTLRARLYDHDEQEWTLYTHPRNARRPRGLRAAQPAPLAVAQRRRERAGHRAAARAGHLPPSAGHRADAGVGVCVCARTQDARVMACRARCDT